MKPSLLIYFLSCFLSCQTFLWATSSSLSEEESNENPQPVLNRRAHNPPDKDDKGKEREYDYIQRETRLLTQASHEILDGALLKSLQAQLNQNIIKAVEATNDPSLYSRPVQLIGLQGGRYYVSQQVARQLCGWDCYGYAIAKTNAGNRRVLGRGEVHFKLSPGGNYGDEGAINDIRPGMEWAISSLFNVLSRDDQGNPFTLIAPPSTLLVMDAIEIQNLEANLKVPNSPYPWTREKVLSGEAACFEELLQRNPDVKETLEAHAQLTSKRAIFQASMTITGESLDNVLAHEDSYDALIKNLDSKNFAALFLGTLLTNPSDGKADNYIVTKVLPNQYGLVCIDNDESLVSPFIRYRNSSEHFPQLKSILFFFPTMTQKFDKTVRGFILNKSPDLLLYQWLQSLEDQNARYADLVREGAVSEKTLHNMMLPIRLSPGLVKNLYEKLCLIQKILRKINTPTYNEIFKTVEPSLYRYYKALQQLSPEDLLTLVDRHKPNCSSDFEQLLKANLPFPLTGMLLLQARQLGGPFSFEALLPKTPLEKGVLREAPFSYEEYENQTVPLIESLRELILINPQVAENIVHYATHIQDGHALSYLLSWGIGSPQHIIKNLATLSFPLTQLNLQSKPFTDEEARQLGRVLPQRKELTTLNIITDPLKESANPTISPQGMDDIMEGLKDLPSLTFLTIKGYSVGPENILHMQKLTHLQELSIPYTNLKNNGAFTLSVRFYQLRNLNLAANGIEASGAAALLKNLTNLTTLNLSRNKGLLTRYPKDSPLFLEALQRHPSLTSLDLSHGEITNEALDKLADALKRNSKLTSLNLYYNSIHDQASLKGLESLAEHPSLVYLNIGNNAIKDKGMVALSAPLRQHKGAFISLDLSQNSIGEKGTKALKSLLKINTPLQVLNLKKNSLGDKGLDLIIDSLPHNSTLTDLHLGSTNLSPPQVAHLLQVLAHNQSLTLINISGNEGGVSRLELAQQIKQLNDTRQIRGAPPVNVVHLWEESDNRTSK